MDNAKHYDDAEIALIESRCKSNTHRIDELQEHQTALDRLATSVEVLATKQETVEGDVKEIKEDVKAITGKAGKRWDSLVDKVLAVLAGLSRGCCLVWPYEETEKAGQIRHRGGAEPLLVLHCGARTDRT